MSWHSLCFRVTGKKKHPPKTGPKTPHSPSLPHGRSATRSIRHWPSTKTTPFVPATDDPPSYERLDPPGPLGISSPNPWPSVESLEPLPRRHANHPGGEVAWMAAGEKDLDEVLFGGEKVYTAGLGEIWLFRWRTLVFFLSCFGFFSCFCPPCYWVVASFFRLEIIRKT